jgi:hypothetical protein
MRRKPDKLLAAAAHRRRQQGLNTILELVGNATDTRPIKARFSHSPPPLQT